jgi:hypothetical protein
MVAEIRIVIVLERAEENSTLVIYYNTKKLP